jgi:hypothetical protein
MFFLLAVVLAFSTVALADVPSAMLQPALTAVQVVAGTEVTVASTDYESRSVAAVYFLKTPGPTSPTIPSKPQTVCWTTWSGLCPIVCCAGNYVCGCAFLTR